MAIRKDRKEFEKPIIDEEYLMNIMSGDEPLPEENENIDHALSTGSTGKSERTKAKSVKKLNYEELFLVNRFPAGRSGKVVYIRSEYHERLLRIVQLTREEKITLYSYIDNILENHFREYGQDITEYFNKKFKPIL
ncbi:DUF3408 domain-containing protein [Chryseobacterium camelliae]|uniref:DUF3408 domain-containing protein n=1 Tax=Chryseobacterium camelliae TaxID=1265445 RepID=UPI002859F938|nr:DUF3408 domain-containing protein [Chryseobacterium camelliae]MDR6513738.1 hypothetical protein [Chryseobacterium camelliae]